jgi:cyclopropane-fatty-acyl-phospholipid synthase
MPILSTTASTRPHPSHEPSVARAKRVVHALASAAGLEIGGTGPLSLRVARDEVYEIALARGFTGLREAYVDGAWEAEQLDAVTERILSHRVPLPWADRAELAMGALSARLKNLQSVPRSREVRRHYDLGNDLYRAMLDRSMSYSCAYWRDAASLDDAQEHKLDLVCRKLGLAPGMRVLDIGCGWGGFAAFAAERYGVSVVGITLSTEQAALARERCAKLPVSVRVQDYRELGAERFDRVVSIGMMEHVGYKNHRRYLAIARDQLAGNGLFLLHTIGGNVSKKAYDPWMHEHVFPNALLPSAAQITRVRGPLRDRGLAQLRRRLRPHAHGVVRQLRSRLALASQPLRRPLLPHVEVLPPHVRRDLPRARRAALAARALARGRSRGLPRTALTTALTTRPR